MFSATEETRPLVLQDCYHEKSLTDKLLKRPRVKNVKCWHIIFSFPYKKAKKISTIHSLCRNRNIS